MSKSSTFICDLKQLNACSSAVDWASQYDSLEEAWVACERGDWMLWLAGRVARIRDDRKTLTLAACECARLALPHVPEDEERPLRAIEMAEAWACGKADVGIIDLRAAAHPAADAYTAYSAAAAAAAAHPASDAYSAYFAAVHPAAAAYTAYSAAAAAAAAHSDAYAYAAYSASAAAYAAVHSDADAYASYSASAAAYADVHSARKKTLRRCADIVRQHYPEPPSLLSSITYLKHLTALPVDRLF